MGLVMTSISGYTKSQGAGVAELSAGEIDGGCAVVLERLNETAVRAAFWVRGGTVQTVNDSAKAIAPHLTPAPEAITVERVLDVVR